MHAAGNLYILAALDPADGVPHPIADFRQRTQAEMQKVEGHPGTYILTSAPAMGYTQGQRWLDISTSPRTQTIPRLYTASMAVRDLIRCSLLTCFLHPIASASYLNEEDRDAVARTGLGKIVSMRWQEIGPYIYTNIAFKVRG